MAISDYLLGTLLGIAGLVAIVTLYAVGKSDTPIAASVNQVTMIAQTVHSFRGASGTQGRYANLRTADVTNLAASGGTLPQKWQQGGGLVDPYGRQVNVSGCDAGGCVGVAATLTALRFAVTLPGVPQGDCRDLVANDFGPDLRVVYVGAGTTPSTRPMSVAQATASCAAGPNAVTWIFR